MLSRNVAYIKLGVGLILLIFLVFYFDYTAVINQLVTLELKPLIAVGIALLLSTLLGGINAYLLIGHSNEISLKNFIAIYWFSWSVGLVVPGQVGDVASLSILLRRYGLDWHKGIGRSLLDKLITLTVTIIFSVYGIISLFELHSSQFRITIWLLSAFLVIFSLLYWQRNRVSHTFNPTRQGVLGIVGRSFKEIIVTFLTYKKRVLINFLLTFLKIFLTGLAYWFMFSAVGTINLDIFQVIPLAILSSIIAYIPISLNGMGTVEITAIALFSIIGLPETIVLSVYLAMRILVLSLAWFPVGVWFVVIKSKSIFP